MTGLEKYKDFKGVFDKPQGRRVMADLANFCCYNASTLVTIDHKVDPFYMMTQEGKRQVYLYILSCLIEPKDVPEQKEKGVFD